MVVMPLANDNRATLAELSIPESHRGLPVPGFSTLQCVKLIKALPEYTVRIAAAVRIVIVRWSSPLLRVLTTLFVYQLP